MFKRLLVGMMLCWPLTAQTPVYDSAGTAVASATVPTTHNPTAPATVNAGDILILHINAFNDEADAAVSSVPSGYSLVGSETASNVKLWGYCKVADGTEDGANQSVTLTGGTSNDRATLAVYRFTASGGFSGCPTGTGVITQDVDTPITGPTLTTTGPNQLGVLLINLMSNTTTMDSLTGESGGDWIERLDTPNGFNGRIGLQTADLTGSASISGGSDAITSSIPTWIAMGCILSAPISAGGQRARRPIVF